MQSKWVYSAWTKSFNRHQTCTLSIPHFTRMTMKCMSSTEVFSFYTLKNRVNCGEGPEPELRQLWTYETLNYMRTP